MKNGITKEIKLDDNLTIVLDTNSSSIHLFDKEALSIYNDYKNGLITKENLESFQDSKREIFETILNLENRKILFSEGVNKDDIKINENLKSICLNVSHTCNLGCPYCFAKGGSYNKKDDSLLMSRDTAFKAIDFLIKNSNDRKLLEVDFFGGEPLLNFDVIKDTISYGNKVAKENGKVIKWAMTTNGVVLNEEIQDYLIENNLGCVLSIDGRKEVHDKFRFKLNGEGSYDTVLKNFQQYISKTEDYVARGTYTAYNLDFYKDVEELKNKGFKHISLEPVVIDAAGDGAITKEHLEELKKSYKILGDLYIKWYATGEPIDFFHFNVSLNGGPCIQKRITNCGASYEYMAIVPNGDIHPCHQLVENSKYKMGNIHDETLNKDIQKEFLASHVLNKSKCENCFAKFHCSGGCHGNNINYSKDIIEPYSISCEIQKIILEEAIRTQVKLKLMNIERMEGNDDITKNKIKNSLEV